MAKCFKSYNADYGIITLNFSALSAGSQTEEGNREETCFILIVRSMAESLAGGRIVNDGEEQSLSRSVPTSIWFPQLRKFALEHLISTALPSLSLIKTMGLTLYLEEHLRRFAREAMDAAYAEGIRGVLLLFNIQILRLGIKRGKYREADDKFRLGQCCICLDELEDDDDVGLILCSHLFHYHCLIKWKEGMFCPLCQN